MVRAKDPKRDEQAAAVQREPLDVDSARATFELAGVGIAHVGLDGSWIRVNQRLCEILGCSEHELRRKTFQDITHPEDLEADLHLVEKVLAGTINSYQLEKRYFTPSGSTVWGNLSVTLVRDEAGEPVHFISIVEDITSRKQLEHELTAMTQNLERRVEERTRDLERSLHELEQFAFVASHDLKQPLRMIHSFVELLGQRVGDQLDEKAQSYMRFICEGTDRMRELLDALLKYSRVGSGDEGLELCALQTILDQVRADLAIQLTESGAILELGELPTVRGNPAELRQVFQNLIDNAIKFSGEGAPHIVIQSELVNSTWFLRVRDFGVGLAPEHVDDVFVLFKRLHHHEVAGTGIGLSIVKRVIERLGGGVSIEPRSPGCLLTLTLPAVEPTAEAS